MSTDVAEPMERAPAVGRDCSRTLGRVGTEQANRNLTLDVIRFLAILLVFFCHTMVWVGGPAIPAALERGGGSGVDLFFVLSGFLIGGLLFLELKRYGRINLKRFYIRRGFKIYPAFYCLLASTLVVQKLEHLPFPPARPLLGEVFFLQNYLGGIRGHTWSLAVEEHFYIVLPLLLVALSNGKRITIRAIVWIYPACGRGNLDRPSFGVGVSANVVSDASPSRLAAVRRVHCLFLPLPRSRVS